MTDISKLEKGDHVIVEDWFPKIRWWQIWKRQKLPGHFVITDVSTTERD